MTRIHELAAGSARRTGGPDGATYPGGQGGLLRAQPAAAASPAALLGWPPELGGGHCSSGGGGGGLTQIELAVLRPASRASMLGHWLRWAREFAWRAPANTWAGRPPATNKGPGWR